MIKTLLATVGGITLLAGAAASTYAVAGGERGDRMFNSDRMVERATKHLDLNDEQQAEVKAVLDSLVPVMRDARDSRRAAREKLLELDPSSADYDTELGVLADAAADSARAMVTQLGIARQDLNAVLTEEQRAEFEDWLSKSRRWGGKHKRGHGMGD